MRARWGTAAAAVVTASTASGVLLSDWDDRGHLRQRAAPQELSARQNEGVTSSPSPALHAAARGALRRRLPVHGCDGDDDTSAAAAAASSRLALLRRQSEYEQPREPRRGDAAAAAAEAAAVLPRLSSSILGPLLGDALALVRDRLGARSARCAPAAISAPGGGGGGGTLMSREMVDAVATARVGGGAGSAATGGSGDTERPARCFARGAGNGMAFVAAAAASEAHAAPTPLTDGLLPSPTHERRTHELTVAQVGNGDVRGIGGGKEEMMTTTALAIRTRNQIDIDRSRCGDNLAPCGGRIQSA